MSSSDNLYFILTKKSEYLSHIKVGSICYISKEKALKSDRNRKKLPIVVLGSRTMLPYDVEVSCLNELNAMEAELLLTLPDEAERLKKYKDIPDLNAALRLTEGTEVTVNEDGKKLRGIIRYIGRLTETSFSRPLTGTYFGIELQGQDKGKGKNNGSHNSKPLFSCDKKCGIFATFSQIQPVVGSSTAMAAELTADLTAGDRVTYFTSDKCRHGMVVALRDNGGEQMVRISTEEDDNGKTGGEVEVPLDMVFKGEIPTEDENMDIDVAPLKKDDKGLQSDLSIDSMVELTLGSGNSFGIIRWIGILPGRSETMVGLELEEENGVSDGTFKDKRFFECPPKKALFVKLRSCRPDSRFQSMPAKKMLSHEDKEEKTEQPVGRLETVPPVSPEEVNQILVGRMKGIQGHCNSCYMDAALFSLFSCSSVLDSMLFKSTEPHDAPIQKTLLHDIVNPLRSRGFVEGQYVMKLRQQLQKHGYSHSFTTDEKDPEEFLTVVMHQILALDPLLKLSAGGKVQESYYYQIFLDQNHSLVLPTVQQLVEHSFHSAGLKLAEVPSCLILQMPRFGKKFKMFDKIIPSLELDVTDLLSEGPLQCIVCGKTAEEECSDCFQDSLFSRTGFKVLCKTCSSQVHRHPQRRSHQPAPIDIPEGYAGRGSTLSLTRDKLELFAVLCIETSHYVSFIKYGPNSQDWLFFDSMADRQGERDGFNIPEVRICPEVAMYLEMSPAELATQVPRDMEGVAKRLFCDAYMYLYQSTSMSLYR
ncbi:uncharacterized protein V6R79_000730 [Siganus canaliculatus]